MSPAALVLLLAAACARASPAPSPPCPPVPPAALAAAGVGAAAGVDLCWLGEEEVAAAAEAPLAVASGIPPGLNCTAADWCDSKGRCTSVCARGSVTVDPWLAHALATQRALGNSLPFCDAPLLGTHNSAITLADGYGALDPAFRELFAWVRWARGGQELRTNNQFLSLTDQLNLGVRAVELDVHWAAGALRIAHCGGFQSRALDGLVASLNAAAALLRRPFRWDAATVGCSPSLSSIPAGDQRAFEDAAAEVGDWMKRQGNDGEFLLLYLDDQPDLAPWGLLPAVEAAIVASVPGGNSSLFTPADLAAAGGVWPPVAVLARAGKRAAIVSGTDYGPAAPPSFFARGGDNVCGWIEPRLAGFRPAPHCDATCGPKSGCAERVDVRALDGRLLRVLTCELQYGPFNCDFALRADNE